MMYQMSLGMIMIRQRNENLMKVAHVNFSRFLQGNYPIRNNLSLMLLTDQGVKLVYNTNTYV